MKVNYRPAVLEDAQAIADLHAANWRSTYRGNFRDEYLDSDVFAERAGYWNSRLRNAAANQLVLVAETGAEICGFLCAFGNHDPEWGSFIDNLHVDGRFRGRGIGTGLLHGTASSLSDEYPDTGVYLHVWENNPAIRFYEKLGGRTTGVVDIDNPGGGTGRYVRIAWDNPDLLARDSRAGS